MKSTHAFAFVLAALLGLAPDAALNDKCLYQQNVQQTCGALACVPDDPSHATAGASGHCGPCAPPGPDDVGAEQCGGRACKSDGTCAVGAIAVPPNRVWPTFHLAVIEVSTSVADATGFNGKPIIGAGYLFQGAFDTTHPKPLPNGGWTSEVPTFYFELGLSLAFAGKAQNAFANAGLTAHVPSWPLGITSVSLEGVYQRTGASIWQLGNATENVDRLGPSLELGFLYNVFLRVAYVSALNHQSPQDHGAVILSVVYMRDLVADLVPDRFQKYIPESLR